MKICDKHEIAFDEYHHPGTGSWRTAWNKKQCPVCEAEAEIRRHEKCAEELRETQKDLLASCKELRDALAGAMRTMDDKGVDRFMAEMARIGIADGIGGRAKVVIGKAEGREDENL